MTDQPIREFRGNNRFLSNFYPAIVELDGVSYPTVEHAYQAAKTLDYKLREQVNSIMKPGGAKRWGRKVALRYDWEIVKQAVMLSLLRWKFARQPLRGRLLATGRATLIEGNVWGDTYWGLCEGVGENKLGVLLMQVREEMRK